MADLQKLVVRLEAETARYQRELDGARKQLAGFEKGAASASAAAQRFNSMITGAAVTLAARQVTQWADAYTGLQNRLKLVTDSQQELASATEKVFDIAQRSRADLAGTSEVYFKIAQNADALGISQEQVARATETFVKSISLSGTTAQGAAGGITQFGQALAAGVTRAEEFNSIADASPAFIDALATSLGKTRGELRKFVNDGLLDSKLLTQALLDQAETIDSQYAKTSATVEQSMTKLSNSFIHLVGELEKATGVFAGVAGGIDLVASSLDHLGDYRDLMELLATTAGGARVGFGFAGAPGAVVGGLGGAMTGAFSIAGRMSVQEQAAARAEAQARMTGETGMSMAPATEADAGMSLIPDGYVATVTAATTAVTAHTAAAKSHAVAVREVEDAYDFQSEAMDDATYAADQLDAMYRQNEAAILGIDQASLAYQDTLGQLEALYQAGIISADQYAAAAKRVKDEVEGVVSVADLWDQNTDRMMQAGKSLFSSMLTDGKNWKDNLLRFFDQIAASFADMAAEMAMQALFGSGSGGGGGINWGAIAGSLVGSLFGAGGGSIGASNPSAGGGSMILYNADGGMIPPGGTSWVGEEGPELITTSRATRVFSNEDSMAMAGGKTVIQNWTFNTPDADSFRASRRQIQRRENAALRMQ